MKKGWILAIMFVLSINTPSANANDEILLGSRRFTPDEGITTAAKAKIEEVPDRAHVLIQLEHIPTVEERQELELQGIKLLSYIPKRTWLASIPSVKAGEFASLSNIRAICEILPEDKISTHIKMGELFEGRVKDGKADFVVQFFKDVTPAEIEQVMQKHNANIAGWVPSLNSVVAAMPIYESINLGFEETVKWVEQELPLEPTNNGARAAIGADIVQAAPYNLCGTGIGVLVYDGGLVDYTHDDFGGRVILGESGSTSSHATHVAGTVGGDGSRSEAKGGTPLQWRGMAPAVDIISYYVSGSCDYWLQPPECLFDDSGQMADMNDNFNEGITTYGADIGTASVGAQPARWGISCDYEGDYSPFAQLIDTIIYDNSIPITWAAANERGYGTCGTTYNTISPTATGKNAIIVGATNSNDDSMTDFSSWGPTDDGRVKPDVVAPGCQVGGDEGITSTVPGNTYDSYCGTSMATPAVAGSVALMLEEWRNTYFDQADTLPSTIKAILIQTAKDLGNTGPDYSYGYGKIDVNEAIGLIMDGSVIEDVIIDQNDKDQFTFIVPQNYPALKITLVWDDYPGDPAAANALVNDLDLIVKDPNGTRYYPWILNPSNPADPATRAEDHINNVEQVYVANPVSGAWTIEVNGTVIAEPVQKYSLVRTPLKLFRLSKEDDLQNGNSVLPGDIITYTISYNYREEPNVGDITDVSIIDYLPEEIEPNNPLDPNYDPVSRTYTWSIGTLSPGESNSVTLTVTVNELAEPLGTITNRAVLTTSIGRVTTTEITDVNAWSPPVIYVDVNATGAETGMSWKNAYRDLQYALDRAQAGYGSQIWVAAGTYHPSDRSDEYASFKLVEGVPLYGGFLGYEASPSERNLANPASETILSGVNKKGVKVLFVVEASEVVNTRLDGFTARDGRRDINYGSCGVYIFYCPLTIANCEIVENGGHGIHAETWDDVTITNCRISGNNFNGIKFAETLNHSTKSVTNCIISGNGSDGNRAGILIAPYGSSTSFTIRNNTIVNNASYGIEASTQTDITNCILWDNGSGGTQNCNKSYCWENDPCFIDTGEPNEFHLGPNSPCIDAGDPAFNDSNETDLDGECRIMDGDFNGTDIVDIGADEYHWPKADYDKDLIVDFNDYCTLAAAWRTVNPTANLIGFSAILLNDLEAFCSDWLWVAPWSAQYETMMQSAPPQAPGFMPGVNPPALETAAQPAVTTAASQPTEPLNAERIEELIDWTEQLLETDPGLKETISQAQIDIILDSLKAELEN